MTFNFKDYLFNRSISKDQGRGTDLHILHLFSLVKGLEAKKVAEFGCGQSSAAILGALEYTKGNLISNDMRALKDTGMPQVLWAHPQFKYVQGDRRQFYEHLTEPVDLLFHDGVHTYGGVLEDIKAAAPMVKKNGFIVLHDTNFKVEEWRLKEALQKALLECRINYEMMEYPYGYGLTIVKVTNTSQREEVEITWTKNSQ